VTSEWPELVYYDELRTAGSASAPKISQFLCTVQQPVWKEAVNTLYVSTREGVLYEHMMPDLNLTMIINASQ
jgi:hypothetical protein